MGSEYPVLGLPDVFFGLTVTPASLTVEPVLAVAGQIWRCMATEV